MRMRDATLGRWGALIVLSFSVSYCALPTYRRDDDGGSGGEPAGGVAGSGAEAGAHGDGGSDAETGGKSSVKSNGGNSSTGGRSSSGGAGGELQSGGSGGNGDNSGGSDGGGGDTGGSDAGTGGSSGAANTGGTSGDTGGSGGSTGGTGGNTGGSTGGSGGSPPECSGSEIQCADADHEKICDNGFWSAPQSCTYTCVPATDRCGGVCIPDRHQCQSDGKTPEHCDSNGDWIAETPCAALCAQGACTTECTNGETQCSGNNLLLCSGGLWGPAPSSPCPYVCNDSLSPPACDGECVPTTTECESPSQIRTCNDQGYLGAPVDCVNSACQGTPAACSGSCFPGDTECGANNALRTCSPTGSWSSQPCSNSTCFEQGGEASCIGSCAPQQVTCTSNDAYDCDASGQWSLLDECIGPDEKCSGGACVANPPFPLGDDDDSDFPGNCSAAATQTYAFPLPALQADVEVLYLGVVPRASTIYQVEVAVYDESGGGPNSLLMRSIFYLNIGSAIPNVVSGGGPYLQADTNYWIAITFQSAPGADVGERSNPSSTGYRNSGVGFPALPDPFSATDIASGIDWPIYAIVQEIVN